MKKEVWSPDCLLRAFDLNVLLFLKDVKITKVVMAHALLYAVKRASHVYLGLNFKIKEVVCTSASYCSKR